jgi:hypothetical protein
LTSHAGQISEISLDSRLAARYTHAEEKVLPAARQHDCKIFVN